MSAQQTAPNHATESTTPPRTVDIAFWLYIAAAAVYVPSLIIGLTQATSQRADLISGGMSATRADATVHLAIGILVVGAALGIILLGLMAVLFRGGASWARVVLIVLTGLSIVGLIPSITAGYGLPALHVLLMIGATIYALFPPSSRWLAVVKAAVKSGRLR